MAVGVFAPILVPVVMPISRPHCTEPAGGIGRKLRRMRPAAAISAAAGVLLVATWGCDRDPPSPPIEAAGSSQAAPEAGVPSADDPRINVARKLLRDGRFDVAETALRTVLADEPESDRARFFLALSIAKQKRYGEARILYDEVAASSRTFPERRHLDHFHGWTLYYLGEPLLARAAFLRHAEAVPEEGDSAFGLGLIALELDERAEAERWLQEAIRRQQSEPALSREVAKAEARLGDLRYREDRVEEAVEHWRRCVALWPDHHEAWSKLSRGYARLDRPEDAAMATRQWEAALARIGRPLEGAGTANEFGAGP